MSVRPTIIILAVLWPLLLQPLDATGQSDGGRGIMVDDFERYEEGGLPVRWSYLHDRQLVALTEQYMRPKERFTVVSDHGNKVLRVQTEGEAVHLTLANGTDVLDWRLSELPVLTWEWRALSLPNGAREDIDSLNDSAAALYVVFSLEGFLVKRPKTIKYVYSSVLPEGTVVSYGKLKVVVVSSGATDGWKSVRRNLVEDYRTLCGGDPPDNPLSIRLWGDSDNTGERAVADFDNIRLSPASE